VPKKEQNLLLKVATLGTAVPLILILYGLQLTGSIEGTFFIQLQSVFGIILTNALLKEKIKSYQYYSIFFIIVGSFLIIIKDIRSILNIHFMKELMGDFLIMIGAIALGYSYVVLKRLTSKVKPELVVSFRLFAGAVFMVPLLALLFLTDATLFNVPSSNILFVILLYTLTNFCIGYVTLQIALEMIPAWMTITIIQTMPLFAIITSVFLLKETITLFVISGGALILLGSFILFVSEKKNSEQ
jgi:drug/metabolite transporter (DMT)-like permease